MLQALNWLRNGILKGVRVRVNSFFFVFYSNFGINKVYECPPLSFIFDQICSNDFQKIVV
jgi:hypothetical protein